MADFQRKPADWMQLPIDERILEVLSSDLILSPTIIGENIDKSREEVNRRLSVLVEQGLVDRVDRGRYTLRSEGEEYLDGDLDASQLESSDE